MNCLACGVEKDPAQKEMYPYDGVLDREEPVAPLHSLDVQGPAIPSHPLGYSEYRKTVVCLECFHRLEPDMWISQEGWESLNPLTPYNQLPFLQEATIEALS